MKDKHIINIISKIYAVIISFLSFIALSLVAVFIILQNGLYLENLSISNIHIENLYIKWNERLNISAQKIIIRKSSSSNSSIKLKDINNYLKLTSRFLFLTDSVLIEELKYGDIKLRVTDDKDHGTLVLKSPRLELHSHFAFQKHYFIFTIDNFETLNKNLLLNAKITLDMKKEEVFSKFHLSIDDNNADLTLYAHADKSRMDYIIKSNKDIVNIHKIISLFKLPKAVKYWAVDAIDAQSLTIKKAYGFVQFNDPSSIYRHLHIYATLNRLNYSYNPKLDAIHTEKTDLEFRRGILYIYPKKAYSYGMYLDKSWLKIDFTQKEELLTLQLLFNGILNKEMLNILNTYHIKLPFLQHSGKVKTDLIIKVSLRKINIDAHGTFYTKKANFDYLGLNIDISDTFIKLDNYDVTIPKMQARYKNIADANVTVDYNAKEARGNINFLFNSIKLDSKKYLNTTNGPLKVNYEISPKGDSIIADKSYWNFNSFHLNLQKQKYAFNLSTLKLMIPTTYIKIDTLADGYITGELNIKKMLLDLKLDLLNFKYYGIKLAQSNTELNLKYKNHLSIVSNKDFFLSINGSPYKISNLQFFADNNEFSLINTRVKISDFIETRVNALYNLKKKSANITLNDFVLINPKNKEVLYSKKNILLKVKKNKNFIKTTSKELDASFIINNKQWLLKLDHIGTITKNSNFLKKYEITNGKINFYKKSDQQYTQFQGNINYKYKFLTDNNRSVKEYKLQGYISKSKKVYLKINDKINATLADNIKITLHDGGINLNELLKFVNFLMNMQKKEKLKKETIDLFFKAKNSYLYVGHNRYIISNKMSLQYFNNMVTAQLSYEKGEAGFKLKNNNFYLYGKNFNDMFMEKLFSLSKFNGGSLDFSMNGTFHDYEGTFYIKDTRIQDYIVLNNILAFINTVPSLATFSLPSYSTKGLFIDNAYMKFHSKKDIFHISDFYIGSKEMKIFGKGTASLKYNNINLALTLKTDLASTLSKIPLVGYIIFDGKNISTTLKVTGELTNPKVKTMIVKDIAIAPLNIIMRTLTLPYKIVKDISEYNSSK